MRAIRLEMHAFGPYRQKQVIDFNQLEKEPIFLITGPTGAGKTTIFDAICFSLYGRASGSERDQDSLRSHFATNDERTSVAFSFMLHQKVYQIKRWPKQLKPKVRGEGYTEEPASASLYQKDPDGTWKLVESKIKEVNEVIYDLIGLDYEQFRKMMMIPQGEFRKLISENSKEREEVLQKIFHTYFYRDLTEKMRQESKQLQEAMNEIQWKMKQETVSILNEEDEEGDSNLFQRVETNIETQKQAQKQQESELKQMKEQLEQLRKEFYEKQKINEWFQELEEKKLERKQLADKEKEINDKQTHIERAARAEQLEPLEQQFNQRKQEWSTQEEQVQTMQQQLEKQTNDFMTIERNYQREQEKEETREALKKTIHEQQSLAEKLTDYQSNTDQLKQLEETIKQLQSQEKTKTEQIQQLEQEKDNQYQKQQHIHEVTQRMQEYTHQLEYVKQKQSTCQELIEEAEQLKHFRQQYKQINNESQKLDQQLTYQKQRYEQLDKERKAHAAVMLAEELQSDAPCPVCGSTHHPEKANQTANVITDEMVENAYQEVLKQEEEKRKIDEQLIQVREKGEAKKEVVQRFEQTIIEELTYYQVDTWKDLSKQLSNRLSTLYDYQQKEQTNLQQLKKEVQQINDIQEQIDQLKQKKEETSERLETSKQSYQELHYKVTALEESLPDDFDSVAQFYQELEQKKQTYQQMLENWRNVQQQYEQEKLALTEQQTKLEQAQIFADTLKSTYQTEADKFYRAISEKGFTSTQDYQSAKLDKNERERLEKEIQYYQERKQIVTNRVNELKTALENKEKPDLYELETKIQEIADKQDERTKGLQTIKLKLQQLQETKEQLHQWSKEYQALEEKYYDVGELAQLARGDNAARLSLERFVLATFLDEILLQANLRFDEMTDHRYQLVRSDELAKRGAQSGLDLEVLDHFTGSKRSVKTLSGGEGFKAALSLALGMADIIQAHAGGVQLDTLFIDEGFGTLDEISLEQAIKCLKDLQQDHRLIGVISHVHQLKEEIKAKLVVETSNHGSTATFQFD
ncbi:exonuclease SbcC [Gracilibacillus halophilus YIM-C55.5]|uniref:Nuclease SbcCD subunit C n=1 Tax=Gracilibacillus halophilus YIM-C55.5 TaxID=1308866 RepID=N4WSB1_9BACI|nr:AAA family ATPase [Gracilibacillus halophilus]ENH97290.1 exonuclease SbcC [Gracilibacillus halophilus YIM-C55.5]